MPSSTTDWLLHYGVLFVTSVHEELVEPYNEMQIAYRFLYQLCSVEMKQYSGEILLYAVFGDVKALSFLAGTE